jgi:formylglycine-generating enzyme required for sulfatase activity
MLYELLLGQPPFGVDGDSTSLMYKHLEEVPPALPVMVPAEIRRVVEQLLAKEPAERLPDALSVSAALESSLAAPPPPDDQSTLKLRRDELPDQEPKPPPVHKTQDEQSAPKKEAPPPPPPAPGAEPREKKKQFRLVGVGLVGLVLLLGGMWYLLPTPSQEETFLPSVDTAEKARQRELAKQQAAKETQQQQYKNMVQIPAGAFWMGCKSDVDKSCFADEKPGREVSLDAFWIDTYEVTVADYRRCVEAGKCLKENITKYESCNWNKPDRADHPINCVDWNQAQNYCEWSDKRLPTEAEWEKAARGEDGRVYPWGNTWDASKANTSEGKLGRTAPVGSYTSGISPYKVHDMVGNVWEWVQDWYAKDYYIALFK